MSKIKEQLMEVLHGAIIVALFTIIPFLILAVCIDIKNSYDEKDTLERIGAVKEFETYEESGAKKVTGMEVAKIHELLNNELDIIIDGIEVIKIQPADVFEAQLIKNNDTLTGIEFNKIQ